jgi:hypothetical protein
MREVMMKNFVRALGVALALAMGCGSDSTAPQARVVLQSVDGRALPAVIATASGFTWTASEGKITSAVGATTCTYDIFVDKSGTQNQLESTGTASCVWSATSVSMTANITFSPSLGTHTYVFSIQ